MGFRVDGFGVESKIFREGVQEGTLSGRHGLESELLGSCVGSEDTELTLLCLTPLWTPLEEVESRRGVWNMVIRVVGWDIEGGSKLGIALKAETFVVAGQGLAFSYWRRFGG